MKLSLVFELLLIFVLLAFAASKSVRKQKNNNKKAIQNKNDSDKLEDNSINKYCKCSDAYCNCCRDFQVPVLNLNGPGCASLMYLNGDKMSVSLSFGKKVITNRTLSSRKPSPVCLPLPGGISKFCGRVYNIARAGEEFRACLGLELQSKSSVEAAVRVSCFKFGPRGVTSEPADPLPLVPQNEKAEEDDDDDDDDFGLGGDDDDDDDDEEDDDDDDDEEGELDAINDVDSADYTGFSLLGEDLLGDLFGSSGSKKPNKNKKKQAPVQAPTTTTRKPRPSRRPSRRPNTRSTTPRSVPTRTTTVRVRPGNRRPTRKPSRRRPSRRPTTATTLEVTTPTTVTTIAPLISIPVVTPASILPVVSSTERRQVIEIETDQTFVPIIGISQKVEPLSTFTTAKSVTNFEDPGIEMSLAHITGQLSAMPVTPIVQNTVKSSGVPSTRKEEVTYEKIETITPKMPSTVSFTQSSEEKVNDDMVQIVQDLDSHSEESVNKESTTVEESRGQDEVSTVSDTEDVTTLPKKKHRSGFDYDDLDVLQLSEIGESVGDQLGIFGRNKRQRKFKNPEVQDGKKENEDYDYTDMLLLDTLMRKSDNKNNRRRQNKMMRGEWSQV